MNEIHELLDRIDAPAVDVDDDVLRGQAALRRRRRLQASGAAASVAALAAVMVAVQAGPGTSGATEPGYADGSSAVTPVAPSTSAKARADRSHVTHSLRSAKQRLREIQRQLTDPASQAQLQTYHDVLAEHLDPGGDRLRLADNEQGGSGTFGTKLDWNHGGMLEISVSTSWRTSDWNAYPPGPGQQVTYRGHQARVLVDGTDLWVAVQHDDGEVVMLVASTSFGNNGTSTSALDLTTQQLLDAAADPRLTLPSYLR